LPDTLVQAAAAILRPRLGYRYWFAYDAAMSPATAIERVPDPIFVTTAHLPSRRFIINEDGRATIVPRKGFSVFGIVWEVAEPALACLDLRLGVPHDWHRYGTLARTEAKPVLAEYHAPRNPRPERPGQADPAYVGPIREAARHWGFPQEYLDQFRTWA